MSTPTSSAAGPYRPGPDDDRLERRDLLVLKLELLRRRRGSAMAASGQRATRNTR